MGKTVEHVESELKEAYRRVIDLRELLQQAIAFSAEDDNMCKAVANLTLSVKAAEEHCNILLLLYREVMSTSGKQLQFLNF